MSTWQYRRTPLDLPHLLFECDALVVMDLGFDVVDDIAALTPPRVAAVGLALDPQNRVATRIQVLLLDRLLLGDFASANLPHLFFASDAHVSDLGLGFVDGVDSFDVQRERLACNGLHNDLCASARSRSSSRSLPDWRSRSRSRSLPDWLLQRRITTPTPTPVIPKTSTIINKDGTPERGSQNIQLVQGAMWKLME
jgi:hypothetical protein